VKEVLESIKDELIIPVEPEKPPVTFEECEMQTDMTVLADLFTQTD